MAVIATLIHRSFIASLEALIAYCIISYLCCSTYCLTYELADVFLKLNVGIFSNGVLNLLR